MNFIGLESKELTERQNIFSLKNSILEVTWKETTFRNISCGVIRINIFNECFTPVKHRIFLRFFVDITIIAVGKSIFRFIFKTGS